MSKETPTDSFGLTVLGFAIKTFGLVIHGWTVVVAFLAKGFLAAVLSFMMPVLSTVYWFFKIGANIGYDTLYCVAIMAYAVIVGGVLLIVGMTTPKKEAMNNDEMDERPFPPPDARPRPEPPAVSPPKKKPSAGLKNLSQEENESPDEFQAKVSMSAPRANSGIDPAILAPALKITGFLVKDDVRTFEEYAEIMSAQFSDNWDKVKTRLHGWWFMSMSETDVELEEISREDAAAVIAAIDQMRAEELKAKSRNFHTKPNIGLDPEHLAVGLELTSIYLEAGITQFEEFARVINDEFPYIWDNVKTNLHQFWSNAAIDFPDIEDITSKGATAVIASIDADAQRPYTLEEVEAMSLPQNVPDRENSPTEFKDWVNEELYRIEETEDWIRNDEQITNLVKLWRKSHPEMVNQMEKTEAGLVTRYADVLLFYASRERQRVMSEASLRASSGLMMGSDGSEEDEEKILIDLAEREMIDDLKEQGFTEEDARRVVQDWKRNGT